MIRTYEVKKRFYHISLARNTARSHYTVIVQEREGKRRQGKTVQLILTEENNFKHQRSEIKTLTNFNVGICCPHKCFCLQKKKVIQEKTNYLGAK